MNVCPDCETPLAQTATECRCGWTLPPVMPSLQTREDVLERDMAEHTERARAYCKSLGLERGADEPYDQWVERIRKHLKATVYGRLVA